MILTFHGVFIGLLLLVNVCIAITAIVYYNKVMYKAKKLAT